MEAIYKIYDLRKYYPNFVGMNSTVVVSDLTEEELLLHCPELIRKPALDAKGITKRSPRV